MYLKKQIKSGRSSRSRTPRELDSTKNKTSHLPADVAAPQNNIKVVKTFLSNQKKKEIVRKNSRS